MSLALDRPWLLLLLPLALLPLLRSGRPVLAWSWLALLPEDRVSARLEALLRAAAVLALAALLLGGAGLHRPAYEVERVGRGAHVVLLIDRSVSMDQPFADHRWNLTTPQLASSGRRSKGKVARGLLADFVERRERDLIGMVAFSTFAIPVLPLTQEHDIVQAAIAAGDFGRGLAETDIGSGLEAAVDFFSGQAFTGSRIILLVSDGAGEMDLATQRRLAHGLATQRITLYWIYIRSSNGPKLEGDDGDDDSAERALHAFFSGLDSPYRAYTAESPEDLERAVADVDRLQNLPIRYTDVVARQDLTGWCHLAAALGLSVLLAARLFTVRAWQP